MPHEKQLVVILIGPPGVGKGSQASKICETFHLVHISTGNILRENIKSHTELGLIAKGIIEKGGLVPDDLVLSMLFDRIAQKDCEQGYLLDGFPRTLPQAEEFEKHTKGSINLKVINLTVSDKTIVERISGRLCCKACSATFHKTFNPPKSPQICDICGGQLYQRSDDQASVVLERLNNYKQQTEPLVDYYQKKNVLKTLSCEDSIEEVFQRVKNLL